MRKQGRGRHSAQDEAAWFDRRVAAQRIPRVIDVEADYHAPLVTFGEVGLASRGNSRWYYYKIHHAELAQYVGKRVLHVACGFGELAVYMAHLGVREVVAFDVSPKSVELARELVRLNGCEDRVRVDVADVRDLPYEDDSFDLVTGEDALHHIIKYEGSMESLHRVLKPGCKAVFCDNFAFDPVIRLLRPLNWKRQGFTSEHSLDAEDLVYLRRVFDDVRVTDESVFYTYSRLLARPGRVARTFSRTLRRLDDVLLPRFDWLRARYSLARLELHKAERPTSHLP